MSRLKFLFLDFAHFSQRKENFEMKLYFTFSLRPLYIVMFVLKYNYPDAYNYWLKNAENPKNIESLYERS